MALPLDQRKILLGVIKELFTSLEDFKSFVRDNTGRNVEEIVVGNLANSRSRLVDNADAFEWLGELIEALRDVAGPQSLAKLDAVDLQVTAAPVKRDELPVLLKTSLSTPQLLEIVRDRLGEELVGSDVDGALARAAGLHFIALAKAVRGMRSMNPDLRRQLEELGLLAPTPGNLQQIVNESNSFLDIQAWLARLTDIEGCVCRIGRQTPLGIKAKGTGFLVGPSAVLTNHHVVSDVIAGKLSSADVCVQFDYRVLKDGTTDNGTVVRLNLDTADSWRIDSAPHSAIDGKVHAIDQEPDAAELDYALLRLAMPIGALPIGPAANSDGVSNRGWLDLNQHGRNSANASPVFVVQHPSGLPMKLAFDTSGVIGYSPNSLRMRYRTNTLKGSSGSPVFNQDLELLALHHAGDPQYPDLQTGQYNEGVPIPAIVQQLRTRDVLAQLAN